MKKTGEILKNAREEKGFSVHEVGLFLKINTRILQAIEDGDQSQLPAKTFLRGFIQSYAKFLKLDAAFVLKVFNEETLGAQAKEIVNPPLEATLSPDSKALEKNDPKVEVPAQEIASSHSSKRPSFSKDSAQSDSLKLKTIVGSAFGLLLVFVIYFTNNVIKKYQREAEVPDLTAVVPKDDPPPLTSATPLTSQSPIENILPQNVPDLSLQKPSPPENTSAAPQPPPQNIAQTPTPPPQATPNAAPAVATEEKSVEVIVEAKENVEIEYSSAKSTPQKILMKIDQIHTFKSRSGVRLKISNGGAVNVIVNGQDKGAPGVAGQSVQVSYE